MTRLPSSMQAKALRSHRLDVCGCDRFLFDFHFYSL